jgi:hypothetical protein
VLTVQYGKTYGVPIATDKVSQLLCVYCLS